MSLDEVTFPGIEAPNASRLVAACEEAWRVIQSVHPEVPDAVIILGSGVERGRLVKLGHWWAGRWMADGNVRGEVLLAGEALNLSASDVFEVLLHEAAHGLCAARGVKDTSRGGRYHNARFRAAATELELDVKQAPPCGWARTTLSDAAIDGYWLPIGEINDAMRIARLVHSRSVGVSGAEGNGDSASGQTQRQGRASTAAVCGCGRRMRMAPTVLAAGPVMCGLCSEQFVSRQVEASEHRTLTPAYPRSMAVVDESFLARRRAALARDSARSAIGGSVVEETWARLATVLKATEKAGIGMTPAAIALGERVGRLAEIARAGAGAAGEARDVSRRSLDGAASAVAGVSRQGLSELAAAGVQRGDEAIVPWYTCFCTEDDEPMLSSTFEEMDRRNALARGLLKADGTLTGVGINVRGREFLVGDRVVAGPHADADGFVSPGVLGKVVRADRRHGLITVDFPTDGEYELDVKGACAASLEYGYTLRPDAVDHVDVRSIDLSRAAQAEVVRLGAEVEL